MAKQWTPKPVAILDLDVQELRDLQARLLGGK